MLCGLATDSKATTQASSGIRAPARSKSVATSFSRATMTIPSWCVVPATRASSSAGSIR